MTNCNYSEHTKIQRKEIQKQIEELQEKLQKLEEIEKQPRMNLQQEGEYAVVLYHDKVYYRLGNKTTFSWYIKKDESVYYVPTLIMISDAETERLLEGLYYNHIQVKKEKVAQEPEDTVWKSVALRFGEKLSDVGPVGYYDFTPEEWFDWAVFFTYGKNQQKDYKVGVDEPSMINCVLTGNPPDGYVTWNEWYNEMGSKGILHNLKISSKDYQPTPQTLEQTEQGLKQAFREAVKQDVVSSTTKRQTLRDVCQDWWDDDGADTYCIDDLVDGIENWFPTEHDTNSYKWNEYIRMMRKNLR